MQILPVTSYVKSLSSSYLADETNVSFLKHSLNNIEGFNFNCEEYLLSAADSSINNYSSLYLTSNNALNNFVNINNTIDSLSSAFSTTLILNAINGITSTSNILTLSTTAQSKFTFTGISNNLTVINNTYFNVELLTPATSRIIHRLQNVNYYLTYTNSLFQFLSTDNSSNNIFNYVLDTNNNLISFFIGLSSITLGPLKDKLILINNTGATQQFNGTNTFKINYYLNNLAPKINTDWVSYNTCDVNQVDVNINKSYSDLTNNYLVNTQYSNVTGDNISVNLLQLKNQYSHSNYNYRADYINSKYSNNLRNYTGLFAGNNEELGKPNIELNYEFYNADYKFICDKYTVFITPQSLYPYTQLNINDTKWSQSGAIGGSTPYYSDKLFFKRDSDLSFKDGQYVCTWLSAGSTTSTGVWYDRYYYPAKTSFYDAIAGGVEFTSIDPIEILINNNATLTNQLTATPFFDKKSDLVLLPNTEYIYQRVGNKYVKDVLDTLKDFYVSNGLSLLDANNAEITIDGDVDDAEYILDNNTYSLIKDYKSINNPSQFTLSFSIECDDWTKPVGHQIIGNLNDKGIALLDDRLITPLLYIQNQKYIYIYNTDFKLIDTVTLAESDFSNITKTIISDRTTTRYTTAYQIQSIHRTDHLDFASAVIRQVQYNCTFTGEEKTTVKTVQDAKFCPLITTDAQTSPKQDLTPITTESGQILIYEPCAIEPSKYYCSCSYVNLSAFLKPSVKFDSYDNTTTTLIIPATGSSINKDDTYNWDPWFDTGVFVYLNHTLTIAATGTTQSIGGTGYDLKTGYGWSHGSTTEPTIVSPNLYPYYGPAGFIKPPYQNPQANWPTNPNYFDLNESAQTNPNITAGEYKSVSTTTGLLTGKALGRLIGKIGNNPPFEVSSNYTTVATVSGKLYLAMNNNNVLTRTFAQYQTTNAPTKGTVYSTSAKYVKYGITLPADWASWENSGEPIDGFLDWNTFGSITDSPYSNNLGFLNATITTNYTNWFKFNTGLLAPTGCPYYAETKSSPIRLIYNSTVCNWTLICSPSDPANFSITSTSNNSRIPDGNYNCGGVNTAVESNNSCYDCTYPRTSDLDGVAYLTATPFLTTSVYYPYADSYTLIWDFRQDLTGLNPCPLFTYHPNTDPIALNRERLVYTPSICGWTLYINFAGVHDAANSPTPTLTAILPNSKDPWGVYTFIDGTTVTVSKTAPLA